MKPYIIFTAGMLAFGVNESRAQSGAPGQHFKRVIQIVFENTAYDKALAQPDFASMVRRGGAIHEPFRGIASIAAKLYRYDRG